MKKLFSIFTAVVLLICAAGCAARKESSDRTQTKDDADAVSQNGENTDQEAKNADSKSKVLVVYYSATGNTEQVAKIIADETNADLFVITPKKAYTSEDLNWGDSNARVSIEHDHPDSRNVELVATKPANFEAYDTIFIGYPIWWGIAAWPVDHFVKENDFTGKTVIPFCTAASSDIGESGDLLAQMAGTGEWQQGRRFYGSSSADEISGWLAQLGY